MQILVRNDNVVINKGTIKKGHYPVDPSIELYKIENENGTFYAVTDFALYDVENIPSEVTTDGKWCYKEKTGFFKNPNWKQDEKSEIETLKRENELISAKLEYLAMMSDIDLPE